MKVGWQVSMTSSVKSVVCVMTLRSELAGIKWDRGILSVLGVQEVEHSVSFHFLRVEAIPPSEVER